METCWSQICLLVLFQIAAVAPLSYKHLKEREWRAATVASATFRVLCQSSQSCLMEKKRRRRRGEEKRRRKREMCWLGGGRDKKGFSILFDSRVSAPSFSAQPRQLLTPHACLQSCALHCFLKYLLRWRAWLFLFFLLLFFFFFFKNTSLQMNAYTAALSVTLPNCCVLTGSCNIHSKNGSPAWMKAQSNASLHWCSVTVFCKYFIHT